MKTAITNANIVLENGIIWDGVLIVEDGKITDFGKARDLSVPADADVLDAEGAYVGPGFVDIHVHGCTGMNITERPLDVCKHFLAHGETSILITPAYRMSVEQYLKTFEIARDAMKKNSCIKGIYMEGPFINPKYGAGAHLNPWHGGIPADARRTIINGVGDITRVWAIAPEREDIMDVVTQARELNPSCVFSVAHSEATPAQIRALGTTYRPRSLTHFGCATGRLPVYGGTRGYGPDEYCYSDNEMYAELISDSYGVHVHPDLQKALLKSKGYERIVLISDSTSSANPSPENLRHVTDINFDDRGTISGSKLTLDVACRNIMTHTSCGIVQAFVMASLNPAKVIGLDREIGSIERGKTADLVFVDDRFNVKNVMLSGEICKL